MSKLDRDEFKAWLEGFGLDEVVGYRRQSFRCPLARFSGRRVSSTRWARMNGAVAFDGSFMPSWARELVHLVDTAQTEAVHVTAREALSILEGIPS